MALSHWLPCVVVMVSLVSCQNGTGGEADVNSQIDPNDPLLLEAWADNWFAMYVDGELVVEDSVSITTERSFNAERVSFAAERPFVAAFVLKDFKENDSGLEYIGTERQQMGDGGFIAQIIDQATGAPLLVSNGEWKCLVIHEAPLDKSCESSSQPDVDCEFRSESEPEGWQTAEFDDSAWSPATVHSASSVDPKDGYDAVTWDASAQLIWGADLEADNTILCRVLVQ